MTDAEIDSQIEAALARLEAHFDMEDVYAAV